MCTQARPARPASARRGGGPGGRGYPLPCSGQPCVVGLPRADAPAGSAARGGVIRQAAAGWSPPLPSTAQSALGPLIRIGLRCRHHEPLHELPGAPGRAHLARAAVRGVHPRERLLDVQASPGPRRLPARPAVHPPAHHPSPPRPRPRARPLQRSRAPRQTSHKHHTNITPPGWSPLPSPTFPKPENTKTDLTTVWLCH